MSVLRSQTIVVWELETKPESTKVKGRKAHALPQTSGNETIATGPHVAPMSVACEQPKSVDGGEGERGEKEELARRAEELKNKANDFFKGMTAEPMLAVTCK